MLRAKLLPIPTADSFFDGTFPGVAGLGNRGLPSLPALTGGGGSTLGVLALGAQKHVLGFPSKLACPGADADPVP